MLFQSHSRLWRQIINGNATLQILDSKNAQVEVQDRKKEAQK